MGTGTGTGIGCLLVGVLALSAPLGGCDRRSQLAGQTNTTMTFHGLAVDSEGLPMPGLTFVFNVESYPKDWTYQTAARLNDVTELRATTGPDGRFAADVEGCYLRLLRIEGTHLRELRDTDTLSGAVRTRNFALIDWGEVQYRSDPNRPATYVFLRDGGTEVSVLPSRGGDDLLDARPTWGRNEPKWPNQPSVKSVTYRPPGAPPPATQPATRPVQTRRDLKLDHFRAVTLDMTKDDVFALVGPPARDVGYYVHEYDLADGGKVEVNIRGIRVEYVRQVTVHGDVWLLRSPPR
jgi:hypothetical protein